MGRRRRYGLRWVHSVPGSFYGVAQAEVEGFVPKSENLSIKAKNIYRFENIKTANYMIIGAVDVKSGKRAVETRAILGCFYESYITDGQLYVAGDSAYWSDRTAESEYIRYTFSTGKAVLKAPERVNLPAFIELADDERRTDGVESFEITENKIVSKGEFANQSNLMYYGSDIIVGDYVYSFDKNDEAEENDKVTIHPYKYK